MALFNNNSNNQNNEYSTDDMYSDLKRNRNSTLIFFLLIIVAYFAYSMFGQDSCGGKTTTGRMALESIKCPYITEFFIGDSDYIKDTKGNSLFGISLQDQIANFYTSSGVQPVIYDLTGKPALSQEELQKEVDSFYEDGLFKTGNAAGKDHAYDEGHFLIGFQADGDSYNVAYHVGEDAKTVIDDDALAKFDTCLKNSFAKNKGGDVFAHTFKDANGQIMGRPQATVYIIIALAVALVLYIVFNYIRASKKRKAQGN